MNTRTEVMRQQEKWAAGRGLKNDAKGYLPIIADNVYAPLSLEAKAAFSLGSGGEIRERPARNGWASGTLEHLRPSLVVVNALLK